METITDDGKLYYVKRYLCALRKMEQSLKGLEERICSLRDIAAGLTSVFGESVRGGQRKDIADVESEIERLQDEYSGDLIRYSSELAKGFEICPTSNKERYLCWLHWVQGLTWGESAQRVGYSADYARIELRNKGVSEIYDLMPIHWKNDTPDAINF